MSLTLELRNISISFPGVKALSDVSFKIFGGVVHALVGENGAGKSTLMNILSGNLQADSGNILIDNQPVSFSNPKHAFSMGICSVHQERTLVENLSIAENIFSENYPTNFFGLIDYAELHKATSLHLERLQIETPSTNTLVSRLSPGQKQMVEIAKALVSPCRILILDEPTASITHNETKVLFKIIRELRSTGVAIIYISHRMNEIEEIADDVTVLKDGKFQGTVNARTTPVGKIIKMMVGRDIQQTEYCNYTQKEIGLDIRNLRGSFFKNITFQLHKGEIMGFAGLIGSGRTEVAQAIFGDVPSISGGIYKGGRLTIPGSPRSAIDEGIAYVPEERISQGIFPEMNVEDNITVSAQKKFWTNYKANTIIAENYVNVLKIRTPSVRKKMIELSGGNQQKVILARALSVKPDVLIVDEPTHGVDVGSKFEIYEMLRKLAKDGISIIVISSELPELLLLSDRIAVMHNGELKEMLSREEATEELIIRCASGQEK